jgi:hypothetical protein
LPDETKEINMKEIKKEDVERLEAENAHMVGKVVRAIVSPTEHPKGFPVGTVGVITEVKFLHNNDTIPYNVRWFDTRYADWWVGHNEVEVCDDVT